MIVWVVRDFEEIRQEFFFKTPGNPRANLVFDVAPSSTPLQV
jgi:hypothetical protein